MVRKVTILLQITLGILLSCSSPTGKKTENECTLQPLWGLWVPVMDQYDSATIAHFLPWLEDGQEIPAFQDTIGIDSVGISIFGSGVRTVLSNDTLYLITGSDPILGTEIKSPLKFELRGEDTLCFSDTTYVNPSTGYFNKYVRVDPKKILEEQGENAYRYWKANCYNVPECFWEE